MNQVSPLELLLGGTTVAVTLAMFFVGLALGGTVLVCSVDYLASRHITSRLWKEHVEYMPTSRRFTESIDRIIAWSTL